MSVLIVKGPANYGARIIDVLTLTIWDYDVTTNEQHSHPVTWTSHPVETGLEITDHAVIMPDTLTLSGIVTDTPLGPAAIPGAVLPDRAKDAYEKLLTLRDSKQLMTVVTGLKVYTDMGIVSVTANRSPGDGQTVRPTIQFRKIRKVVSVEIPIPPELLKPVVEVGAQSPVDAGVQPPAEVPADGTSPEAGALEDFKNESTLNGLADDFAAVKLSWR